MPGSQRGQSQEGRTPAAFGKSSGFQKLFADGVEWRLNVAVAVAGGHLLRETLDQAQTAPKAKMVSGCAGKREIQFSPLPTATSMCTSAVLSGRVSQTEQKHQKHEHHRRAVYGRGLLIDLGTMWPGLSAL